MAWKVQYLQSTISIKYYSIGLAKAIDQQPFKLEKDEENVQDILIF